MVSSFSYVIGNNSLFSFVRMVSSSVRDCRFIEYARIAEAVGWATIQFSLGHSCGRLPLVSYLTPIELRYRIYDATMKIIAAKMRFRTFL